MARSIENIIAEGKAIIDVQKDIISDLELDRWIFDKCIKDSFKEQIQRYHKFIISAASTFGLVKDKKKKYADISYLRMMIDLPYMVTYTFKYTDDNGFVQFHTNSLLFNEDRGYDYEKAEKLYYQLLNGNYSGTELQHHKNLVLFDLIISRPIKQVIKNGSIFRG